MNIRFSWEQHGNRYDPVSQSDSLNENRVSLLDCVLMDGGGLPHRDTLPWLNEGIRRIESVATGELESSDWNRETWGVEFKRNEAKIYSLHDETCFQTLSLDAFAKALREWTAFLRSEPGKRETEAINFSIDGKPIRLSEEGMLASSCRRTKTGVSRNGATPDRGRRPSSHGKLGRAAPPMHILTICELFSCPRSQPVLCSSVGSLTIEQSRSV